jgi:predicted dehydrogenase
MTSDTKRWRFGLAGAGRGSGYGRLLADSANCEVVACCDTSHEALARFQAELKLPDSRCFTDYDRFVSSAPMDAVFIGTPIPAHAEQTVKAVEAGVNVLSEVTAAMTVADCGRIVEAVRRTGRVYMLAENCCYWHFIIRWQELVQSGRLGEPIYSECEYLHPMADLMVNPTTGEDYWRAQRPPLYYCSHSLGPILEITQDRIVRAMGLGNGHRVMPEHPVVGAIDIQVALFETAKGAIIKLLRTAIAPQQPPMHFYMVRGTRGFIETDRRGPRRGYLYIAGEMREAEESEAEFSDPFLPPETRAGGHGTAEYLVLQDFLRALGTGRRPRLHEVRAMDLTVPGIIAHDSAMRGGVWMEVPSFAE